MNILLYAENWDGKFKKSTYELATYTAELAKLTGGKAVALTIGEVAESELKTLGKYGIDSVFQVTEKRLQTFVNQAYSSVIAEIAKTQNVGVLVFANNFSGRALSPRLAVKLAAGVAAGVVQLPASVQPFVVRKKVYSGKAFADVEISSAIKIVTLNQNSFKVVENQKDITIENFTPTLKESDFRSVAKEVVKTSGKVSIGDAEILVSAGRGMKAPENWGMIEALADLLGAATCCSRPVTDINWRPHHEHVGQTGKVVAPNLYIAVGISGAIQHLAGVNGSKVMVAINTDKDAPFFESADYGIIGDAFKVVPKMIEEIKKLKGV